MKEREGRVGRALAVGVVAAVEELQRPDPVRGGGWEWPRIPVGVIGSRNGSTCVVEGRHAFFEWLRRKAARRASRES